MRKFALKRCLACAIAVLTAFTMLASTSNSVVNEQIVTADSTELKQNKTDISDTQSQLDDLEAKQKELDEKISSTKDDINSEEENQAAIEEQIKTVQETISTLDKSIEELNTKITDLEDSIAKSEIQIANKKTEIENGVGDFKERLRAMYVAGSSSYSEILIGSTDFYDMLMKIELVKRVAEHDDTMIDNLVDLKKQFEADEAALEDEKAELETQKAAYEENVQKQQDQKDKLDVLYSESQAYLDKLAADKAAYEENKASIDKEEADMEAQLQQLFKEQEAIKKKEAEEAAKKKAEEEAKKKAEQEAAANQNNNNNSGSNSSSGTGTDSNGNSTSTDANGNTSGQSSLNNSDYNYTDKSQFTWPVPGYYHISYGMGYRWGAYHKGIDIWSQGIRGAKICAAASGTVILVSNTCTHDYGKSYSCGCGGGYGNYCIIDHGNGYWTLYGHSQGITVKQGQHVEQGDVLGLIGSTGHSTGDHLHFEVRINGTAVDPTLYV